MSEPSHLILNLNKIMEAYTKVEEGSVQDNQSGEMQAEKIANDRGEPKSIEEESRKRKRKTEETETKQKS